VADVTRTASGSVTAPAAGAAIATIAAGALPAGRYRIHTEAGVSGNAVADLGNMRLRRGAVDLVSPIPSGASGGMEDFDLEDVELDGASALAVQAIGVGTASIEYNATITAYRIGSL
jgi:hypothetical protein